MLSAWTMGAMASKKASAFSSVRSRIASAREGEVSGPVAMMTDPSRRGEAGDLGAFDFDQRVGLDARGDGGAEEFAVDGERAAGGDGMGVGGGHDEAAAARISQWSRPTAFCSSSSERKEFEQTSSARPSVWCAKVADMGAHLVEDHGDAHLGGLPGGFGAGETAADDVDGFYAGHGLDLGRCRGMGRGLSGDGGGSTSGAGGSARR